MELHGVIRVVPAQAVTAWMQREPDAWAKVVEWFGANGKAIVQSSNMSALGEPHRACGRRGRRRRS